MEKRQMIDPIGGICKLILLNFRELGTKIRIDNTLTKNCI